MHRRQAPIAIHILAFYITGDKLFGYVLCTYMCVRIEADQKVSWKNFLEG